MVNFINEQLSKTELAPVLAGFGATVHGASNLAEGNWSAGLATTLCGFAATDMGTYGHSETLRNTVLKISATTGAYTFAAQGMANLCAGKAARGAVQLAVGVATAVTIASLSSRVAATICRIASVAGFSGFIAYSGMKDIVNGEMKKGWAKTAIGLAGLALSAAVAYCEYNTPTPEIPPIAANYPDPDPAVCRNPDFEANTNCEEIPVQKDRDITIGSTYVPSPDPARGEYARLVDSNHAQYARKWNLTHVVGNDPRLLDRTCFAANGTVVDSRIVDGTLVRCSDYWQKVPEMLRWLKDPNVPMGAERWLIDDDMPITNSAINPYKVFDQVADGSTATILLAKDSGNWLDYNFPENKRTGKNDPRFALNGGLWFLRKSEEATRYLEEVWETRNLVHDLNNQRCPTKGLCTNQDCLHEQEGAARVLMAHPHWFGRHVLVVQQRDSTSKSRGHITINSSNRGGACFVKRGWGSTPYGFIDEDVDTLWRPGDFMGQPNGVPPKGVELPLPPKGLYCWHQSDDPDLPEKPIRKNRIQQMIDLSYNGLGCTRECERILGTKK